MDLATLARRRQLWAQTVVITTLCAQYATLLMASSTDKAQWDEDEIVALLDYLLDHKSAIGEAGSFKMPTFRAAADSISDLLVNGPIKTGKMCKTKWRTLKSTYSAIQKYQESSGMHWDYTTGASIETEKEEEVWKNYVKHKPNAPLRPFRTKGWKYLSKFESIIPVAGAKGKRAFAASTAASSSQMTVATESSDEDDEIQESLYGGVTPAAIGKASKESETDNMEIDGIDDGNATIRRKSSISSGKRKLDHLLDDDARSYQSSNATIPPSSSSVTTSEPAKKKSARSSSRSTSKTSVVRPSSKITKISNAVAMNGIQGTINRLTDIFERSVNAPLDPRAAGRGDALQLLQSRDDGLSINERTKMVNLFAENHVMAEMYAGLVDDELRQSWLQGVLER